jgi:hypothetical protein
VVVGKQVELSHVHDGSLFLLIDLMAEGIRQFLTSTESLPTSSKPGRALRRLDSREKYFAAL